MIWAPMKASYYYAMEVEEIKMGKLSFEPKKEGMSIVVDSGTSCMTFPKRIIEKISETLKNEHNI
jgi:hypothetical protein